MKTFTNKFWLQKPIRWSLVFGLISLLGSCSSGTIPVVSNSLNTRYTEEQPALSGDGRLLAFTSNRNGNQQLLIYDLATQSFIPTPGLNRPDAIAESPSLSYTGRYICYLTNQQGRQVIAIYDRALQKPEILTSVYRGSPRNPQISPDGRYIVFESSTRGQWDIEVLDRGPTIELDIPNGTPVTVPQ
ncbi:MAG TPA: hypothetical protein VK184_06980 [Nostocaceae cyanobacterium]|nr:hypothetical protein [Nostocaceae cyanobacterium]